MVPAVLGAGEGLAGLEDQCLELIADAFGQMKLLIPHARYDLIARAHQIGHVQSEEQRDEAVFLQVRIPPNQQAAFQGFVAAG